MFEMCLNRNELAQVLRSGMMRAGQYRTTRIKDGQFGPTPDRGGTASNVRVGIWAAIVAVSIGQAQAAERLRMQ